MAKTVQFDVLAVAKAQGFDKASREVKKLGDDGEKSISGLATALIGLAPAAVPIGAAAVAAGASVAALGVTGLLAFGGIKKEMAEGTTTGKAYTAGVNTLKGNLDTLERTAARGVLTGFQASVKDLQPLMPTLNSDTEQLSGVLGQIISHIMPGVVSLFETANPLLLDFANDLEHGSEKFQQWATSSTGATKFVEYARAELPKVEELVLSLATAAGHLAQGFAPLGGSVLTDLTILAKVIDAIPVGVLQAAAPAVVALVVALKALQVVDTISGKFDTFGAKLRGAATGGATLTASLGTVGAILAGGYAITQSFSDQLGVLANNFATGKILADQNSSGMDDLRTVYQEITGTVATTSDTLLDFALSTKNSGSGIGELSDEARDVVKHLGAVGITAGQVKAAVGGNDATFTGFVQRLKDSGQASAEDVAALNDLHESFGNTIASAGNASGAVAGLVGAQIKAGITIDGVTYSIDKQTTASGLLKTALDRLNGTALSVEQTQNQFLDTEDQLTASVKQNGTSIDQNSTKGRANREVLVQLIQAASDHAQAIADSTAKTKGLAAGTAAGTASFRAQEAQIRTVAHALGLNDAQVAALIAQIGKVPKSVAPKITVKMSGAEQVKTLKENIAALKSKQIDLTTYIRNVILPTLDRSGQGHGNSTGEHSGPGRATGGPVYAGKQYVVGEKRPELFTPSTNGYISPRLPGGGATAGQALVLEYTPSGNKLIDALFEEVRKGIRVRGGNVQKVLGQ